MDGEQVKLVALHQHWCTADAVNHHLKRSLRSSRPDAATPESVSEFLADLAAQNSHWLALSVWYSLLYVVVEGWRELGFRDPQVDELLARTDMLDALRRFRNAVFHYQADPIGPKQMQFMQMEDGPTWVRELNRAFRAYFERQLNIAEVAALLGAPQPPA